MGSNRAENNFIGECLEDPVTLSFSICGFAVEDHKVHESGVDVTATSGKITIVCECWNWALDSYPDDRRILSVLYNFAKHPYATWVLITAHKVDYGNFKKQMQKYGVKVVTIGKQLLSKTEENLRLVLNRLKEEGVLYYKPNNTTKKTKTKRINVIETLKPSFFNGYSAKKLVMFDISKAFCAISKSIYTDSMQIFMCELFKVNSSVKFLKFQLSKQFHPIFCFPQFT